MQLDIREDVLFGLSLSFFLCFFFWQFLRVTLRCRIACLPIDWVLNKFCCKVYVKKGKKMKTSQELCNFIVVFELTKHFIIVECQICFRIYFLFFHPTESTTGWFVNNNKLLQGTFVLLCCWNLFTPSANRLNKHGYARAKLKKKELKRMV